jgi:hypothetical protein
MFVQFNQGHGNSKLVHVHKVKGTFTVLVRTELVDELGGNMIIFCGTIYYDVD